MSRDAIATEPRAVVGIRLGAALLPSGAVVLGLYGLGNAWAAVLLYHLGILLFAFFLRGRGSIAPPVTSAPRPAGFLPPRRWVLPAVLVSALTGPALYLLWDAMVRPGITLGGWLATRGMSGWSWWLFVPYYGLLHPILEEWHWRRITRDLPAHPRIPDLLFAAYHVLVLATLVRQPWLWVVFVVLFGSSILWRWMDHLRGLRTAVLLTHGVADLSLILAATALLLEGR